MTCSRTKGAKAERDVAKELFAELGMTFKRDLRQYQEAEYGDLVCDDPAFPFSIEVKHYTKGWTCKPAWEAQAIKAAENAGKLPCVIYRHNGQAWRVRVWFDAIAEALGTSAVCTQSADVTIQGFAWIAREIMAARAMRAAL